MTERLRIAVLSRNFSTTGGGAERYAVAVVQHLAAQHEIHVFAQNFGTAIDGVTYHPLASPLQRPRWINQLYFAWASWRATRKGFDVVHSHENTWHGQVQTVHVLPVRHTLLHGRVGVARLLRWLKIITSPRLLAYLWLEKKRYAWGLRKQVVAASQTLRAVLQDAYPTAAPLLQVVTPGVEPVASLASAAQREGARMQLGLPVRAGPWLLFVGNDFARKGLGALLQALVQMPSAVQLLVVGQCEDAAEWQTRVAGYGLADRVHMVGGLRDMGLAYTAADVLVHPTLEDTYGMVVLEAMAHGLPVVVSSAQYCGIAQELTEDVQAQIVQNPKDVDELGAAVERVLQAPYAQSLASAGFAFAQQRSWAVAANAYAAMYQAIARRT